MGKLKNSRNASSNPGQCVLERGGEREERECVVFWGVSRYVGLHVLS